MSKDSSSKNKPLTLAKQTIKELHTVKTGLRTGIASNHATCPSVAPSTISQGGMTSRTA